MKSLILCAALSLLAFDAFAAATRPSLSTPRLAPRPSMAAPVRAMPNFNIAAQRRSASVTGRPAGAPSLTRGFYEARDGRPANGGFAAGTGRARTLQPGSIVTRRGSPDGSYATQNRKPPPGSLGLDPKADREPARHYRVMRPVAAVSGKVAPAWSAPGGTNQLKLADSVSALQRQGDLQRTVQPAFSISAAPPRPRQAQR